MALLTKYRYTCPTTDPWSERAVADRMDFTLNVNCTRAMAHDSCVIHPKGEPQFSFTGWTERRIRAAEEGTYNAAAIDSIIRSVREEIKADLENSIISIAARPNEEIIDKAMTIAREAAYRFARQTWIDIAGFVDDDGTVAVLAHSMETGRRVTFYVDNNQMRAIRTGVTEKPHWSEPRNPEEIAKLLDWISHTAS